MSDIENIYTSKTPCPACGNMPEIRKANHNEKSCVYVGCVRCAGTMVITTMDRPTEAEAIEMWENAFRPKGSERKEVA